MKITCLGCLHGTLPNLPGGDLLILTGDYTPNEYMGYWYRFTDWVYKQKYKKKIVIGGNHDRVLLESPMGTEIFATYDYSNGEQLSYAEYLCNSGTEFENLKIWGTPHSNWFDRINPECTSFVRKEEDLEEIYAQIPDDIDILISHQPFFGVNDKKERNDIIGLSYPPAKLYQHLGSEILRKHVERVNPRLFVCSHIHEGYGITDYKNILCINCSIMSDNYSPDNEPITINLF